MRVVVVGATGNVGRASWPRWPRSTRSNRSSVSRAGVRSFRWTRSSGRRPMSRRRTSAALSGGRRGRPPRVADPALARPGAAVPRERRRLGAGLPGSGRSGGPRSSTPLPSAPTRPGLRTAASTSRGRPTGFRLASTAGTSGCRAPARPLRARAAESPSRAPAAGPHLQARRRVRDQAPLRRAVPPEPAPAPEPPASRARHLRISVSRQCIPWTWERRMPAPSSATSPERSTSLRSRCSTPSGWRRSLTLARGACRRGLLARPST